MFLSIVLGSILLGLFWNRNSWNKPNNYCSFLGYSFQSGCKTFIVTLLTGSDMFVINSARKGRIILIIPAIPIPE